MKEKEFKIRRWRCMTRRCSLCPKKFKSTKELNDHISNEHNFKFLCKFHPCHKAYSSKLSAGHHIHHHSPGRYQCDKCSKMFHEKYVLESHHHLYWMLPLLHFYFQSHTQIHWCCHCWVCQGS